MTVDVVLTLAKRVAIGILLLVAADAALFRSGFYYRYLEPESTAGMVVVNLPLFGRGYRDGTKNVVVIGDSRVGEGFSPLIANEIGGPSGVNFIRIGMPGTTPRVWNYFVDRLPLRQHPVSAVVLMVPSLRDDGEMENLSNRALDISYAAPLISMFDAPGFVSSFHDKTLHARALRASLLPATPLQADLHAFLLSPVSRISKVNLWRKSYADWMAGYSGRPERLPDVSSDDLSTLKFDKAVLDAGIAVKLGEHLRNLRDRPSAVLVEETRAYRTRWFGQIAEKLQALGIQTYVYQMPRGPYHRQVVGDRQPQGSLPSLAEAGKLKLIDSGTFVDLEQPDYFFDFLHLNAKGRQSFSRKLAEVMIPLVH